MPEHYYTSQSELKRITEKNNINNAKMEKQNRKMKSYKGDRNIYAIKMDKGCFDRGSKC